MLCVTTTSRFFDSVPLGVAIKHSLFLYRIAVGFFAVPERQINEDPKSISQDVPIIFFYLRHHDSTFYCSSSNFGTRKV
jgi:hypothetical protein